MNKKKRLSNRENAKGLARIVRNNVVCPECGEKGAHYVSVPYSLQDMMDGKERQGFWTCAKFYGADGRRLEA